MAFGSPKFVRFQSSPEPSKCPSSPKASSSTITKVTKMVMRWKQSYSRSAVVKKGELSRVFSEDYDTIRSRILDPRWPAVSNWNKFFIMASLVSLFLDPLFFFLPIVDQNNACTNISLPLKEALTIVRTLVDVLYVMKILVKFRTAYLAPSSPVIGRGELVIDPSKISARYIRKCFWLDLLASLPIPQVVVWVAVPQMRGTHMLDLKLFLQFTVIIQFAVRLYLVFALSSQIIKATGVVMEKAWAGAVYNLMLFMLASHVVGSTGYLLAVERQEQCWREVCNLEYPSCQSWFFDCNGVDDPRRAAWYASTNLTTLCDAGDSNNNFFQFGIYADGLGLGVPQLEFWNKYLFCFWWGLINLSSTAQNLSVSTYAEEINFVNVIVIVGLVLFALLIGNMQTYLASTKMRLEEWRIRRNDTEHWMRHRQLPHELKQSVRKYDQYRWATTNGVDEESILKGLPSDLQRDIKRHLCLDLVRKVPLFNQMDEHMLDAICERLKPVLCTPATCLVREGDSVDKMLFIIRGHLDSYTTDGGRTGFFNSCRLGPGDFCGEELLTWALDPRPSILLLLPPSSTRTVRAISEVEAFALESEDLKFVASKFRRLHSKQMKHAFRCHSHQWRTWAACFIQAAWFRYKRKKLAAQLKAKESDHPDHRRQSPSAELPSPVSHSELAIYAAKFAGSFERLGGSPRCDSEFDVSSPLEKPKPKLGT